MRIAIIADSHFDSGSRFEECRRLHTWIAEDIERQEVDLILHAGDLYERKSTPEERLAAAAWVQQIAELAPVVIVRGNHDALEDLPLLAKLETRHPVVVEEAAGVHLVAGAAVGCLAWPRKGRLLSQLASTVGSEEADQVAGHALQNVIRGLGQTMDQHDGPRIFLAHAMVRGSKTSTGQPLVGCDMEIGLEDLGLARADLYALGHIHMPQDWRVDGAPVVYPGSPRRTAFGEAEEKGYVIADVDEEGCTGWCRIPTPAVPMILVTGNVSPSEGLFITDPHPSTEGAEVRLRYTVDADHREAAKEDAAHVARMMIESGALDVKIEEVVRPTTRARVPEITTAKGNEEKLRLLWKARDEVPEPDRADRLLSHVRTLEEEIRNASR